MLKSTAPSSILTSFLNTKKNNRLPIGRGNQAIERGFSGVSELQKSHSLLPGTPSPAIPPLQPTVQKLPSVSVSPFAYSFGQDNSNSEPILDEISFDSDTTMTTTLQRMAKTSRDGKSVNLSVGNWAKVLEEIKKKNQKYDDLAKTNKSLETSLAESQELVEELQEQVNSLKKTKNKGKAKGRRDEQKHDVQKAIDDFVKQVAFRTIKFARPGNELKAACNLIWDGIKNNMRLDKGPTPLDREDFKDIYESKVLSSLSERRQYMQSRCAESAKGKFDHWFCVKLHFIWPKAN